MRANRRGPVGGAALRGLIVCCVLAVGLVAASGGSARPSGHTASALQGGSSYDAASRVITVSVDLKGALGPGGTPVKFLDPATGRRETAVKQWQQAVEEIWNSGFRAHAFTRSCAPVFHFTLRFLITPQSAGAPNSPGHHQISLVADGAPSVHNADGPTASADADGPYLVESTGSWGEEQPDGANPSGGPLATTARVIAQQVGHLLGLRDDYTLGAGGEQVPRSGVDPDELMANAKAGTVTQDLVTRVGELLVKAGEIAQCPAKPAPSGGSTPGSGGSGGPTTSAARAYAGPTSQSSGPRPAGSEVPSVSLYANNKATDWEIGWVMRCSVLGGPQQLRSYADDVPQFSVSLINSRFHDAVVLPVAGGDMISLRITGTVGEDYASGRFTADYTSPNGVVKCAALTVTWKAYYCPGGGDGAPCGPYHPPADALAVVAANRRNPPRRA